MADQASGESSAASSSIPVPMTKSAGRFTVAPAEDDDERENGDDGESSPATTEGGATDFASSAAPPAVETLSDDGSDLWPNPTASSDEVATAAADEDDAAPAESEVRVRDGYSPPHHLPAPLPLRRTVCDMPSMVCVQVASGVWLHIVQTHCGG
jgi:hypothetical protein